MATATIDPYGDATKVPARVEVTNRPLRNFVALAIFLVAILVNIVLGAVVMGNAKDLVANAEAFNSCVSASSVDQTQFDVEQVKAGQALAAEQLNSAAASVSLDGITSNAGVLVGLSIAVLVVAGLWVFLLYKFTKAMVWGTLIFNIVVMAALAVFFFTLEGGQTGGIILLVITGLYVLILFCLRNNVNMAAGLINLAMQALRDFPSLILAAILVNLLVMAVYILQMVFIISAFSDFDYSSKTGDSIIASRAEGNSVIVLNSNSADVVSGSNYCVAGQTGLATFGMYFFAIILLWVTATLEAVRMAIASAVFGVFYYFDAEDTTKPNNIVCLAATWAFTVQLGTHAISGMVLAIVDYLRRQARQVRGGIIGCIIRIIIMCFLSLIEQLTKFLVVMTGLTGLGFWDSAKRTMTIMKEAFVDGYITSRITVRVLRLSGYVFALAFGVIAWAAVDSTHFSIFWWFIIVIMIGIISPIFGIVLALLVSSFLAAIFTIQSATGEAVSVLSGPLAGLFFGSIAHAVLLFMEQLILDLVDAAFMCFALDTHNHVISPRGEVVHRYMGTNFAESLSDEGKVMVGKLAPEGDATTNPVADGMMTKDPPPAPPAMPGMPGMPVHATASAPSAYPGMPVAEVAPPSAYPGAPTTGEESTL